MPTTTQSADRLNVGDTILYAEHAWLVEAITVVDRRTEAERLKFTVLSVGILGAERTTLDLYADERVTVLAYA